jgi:hypothetical protein
LFGHQFQFEEIRKAVTLFGTLFNDIWITRQNETVKFKIPVSYGPQQKFLARIKQDADLNRPTALVLPRIGFETTTFQYDGSRKLLTLIKNVRSDGDSNDKKVSQFMGVPYNIGFEMVILAKTQEDATKIVEQILPFFRPHWVIKARVNQPFTTAYNIPIVLNTVQLNDTYDGDFTERRAVVWTLSFTMKTYLFGPASTGKVIKSVDVNFYVPSLSEDLSNTAVLNSLLEVENINITPGLLANGSPTSNQALSIPIADINMDDDYGYVLRITTIEDQ